MAKSRIRLENHALWAKLAEAIVPGAVVELDPGDAELAGAFLEEALAEEDALESVNDLPEGAENAADPPGDGEA